MKNCLYVVFICLIGLNINQSNAQTLTPVFQWDYATTIPSGANTFMDYTDDVCVGAYSSVPGGSAFLLDNAGNNIVTPEPEDVEWVEPVNIVGRFEGKTYFLSTDLVTHTSTIRVMDNATNNFLYHTITWESFYSWIECHEFDVTVIGSVHKLTFLVDVFDASINRNKAVVKVLTDYEKSVKKYKEKILYKIDSNPELGPGWKNGFRFEISKFQNIEEVNQLLAKYQIKVE